MKQIVLGLIVIAMFSSCSPYVVSGAGPGGCGVWHKKKFQGNKPPRQTAARMPIIN
jgi:hypothetical protein